MSYTENKEAAEYEIAAANDALDVIDGTAKKLIELADGLTRFPGIEVYFNDWNHFVGCIEDAVSDLYYKERKRLIEIAGDRPLPASLVHKQGKVLNVLLEALNPLPNKAMGGFRVSEAMREMNGGNKE